MKNNTFVFIFTKGCKKTMKKNFRIKLLFLIIIGITIQISKAQHQYTDSTLPILNTLNKIYGTSDILANGTLYDEPHYQISGHPYFNSEQWLTADLFIKGNTFKNQKIRYNLQADNIVLLSSDENSLLRMIYIEAKAIDSMLFKNIQLSNLLFINTSQLPKNVFPSNYAERIYKGGIQFYRIYYKEHLKNYSQYKPKGEFSEQKQKYYLLNNHDIVEIKRRRDVYKQYPNHKKQIRGFMRKHKIRFRKATKNQLIKLMTFCDDLEK